MLDTGVDLNHPDLQVNLLKNLCKDTSNGTRKQLTGDDDGHGTHVTGIIGATANNGKGVAGVASGEENEFIDMFVVDIFQGDAAYTSAIIEGIEYAVEQDANVINISAGYNSPLWASHGLRTVRGLRNCFFLQRLWAASRKESAFPNGG